MKLSKWLLLLILVIVIEIVSIIVGLIKLKEDKSFEDITQKIETNKNEVVENNITIEQSDINYNPVEIKENKIEEYKNMPKELKGYKVIGKLEIPKIKLETYILAETNTKALKISVTKLYGPDVNKIGNLCIAGHNYRDMKMFGGIKKLEIDDEICVTDTFDKKVKYKVYKTYKTNPKDVSCLDQDTGGEREITLITCTAGAIQRVIVKAVEIYD